MLCLSRDLRAFCVSIGASSRSVCFSGVRGGCLAPCLPRRPRRRRQTEPRASVSPEGALAARQLSAAAGGHGPKRAWRLLFLASPPRAVATQWLRQRWGHEVWPAPRVRQSAAEPLCTAPGRAELAISSSEVHHRCR